MPIGIAIALVSVVGLAGVISYSLYQNGGTARLSGVDAIDDTAILASGQDSKTIYVLDNDFDRDEKGMTLASVSSPSHGSATINEDSSVTYTLEDFGFSGDDIFSYTIRDDNNETDSARIGIKVEGMQPHADQHPLTEDVQSVPLDQVPGPLTNNTLSESDQQEPLPEQALLSPPVGQPAYNQLPVADAGESMIVEEGTFVILKGTASYDPDGDPLEYSWTQSEGPAVRLSNSDSEAASFLAPEVSSATSSIRLVFELTVDDALSGSAKDTVQIEIENAEDVEDNSKPVADAGDVITVMEGSLVALDGTESYDPDGDQINYEWAQISGSEVELTATSASPNFIAPNLGTNESMTLAFELTVDDGNGLSDSDRVVVTVEKAVPNQEPVADAGLSQIVEQNTTVTLNGTGSFDPDGDELIYSWNQTSGTPVSLDDGTSQQPIFDTPIVSETEQLAFVLTVSDGNLTSTDFVDIFVNPANDPDEDENDGVNNPTGDGDGTDNETDGQNVNDPTNSDDQEHEEPHHDRKGHDDKKHKKD